MKDERVAECLMSWGRLFQRIGALYGHLVRCCVAEQRQVLRAVPVTEVEWDWKDERNKRLWVYGNERRVYCPDYPHKCCWGCAIL